jgi:tetratricopeptide (TPR) repeat protein
VFVEFFGCGQPHIAEGSNTSYCVDMSDKEIIGYTFGNGVYADMDERRVIFRGALLKITGKQFDVLEFFLQRPWQTVERKNVKPLGSDWSLDQRLPIDNYISELRDAFGEENGQLFKTVRGHGYRLETTVKPRFRADRSEVDAFLKLSSLNFNDHTTRTLESAIEHSLKGLESPDREKHAELYINLAWSQLNLGTIAYCKALPSAALPKARQAAEAALSLDANCAEALGILGLIALIYEYDWQSATKYLNQALEIDSREQATLHSYAHVLISSGDFEKGLEYARQAVAADPLDKIVDASLGLFYLFARQQNKAEEATRDTLSRFPDFPPAHFIRGLVLEQGGECDEARKRYEQALKFDRLPIAIAALGHLEGTLRNKSAARSALRELRELHRKGRIAYSPAYCDALVYVGLDDKKRALDALEKAYEQNCDWLIHLAVEPRWFKIRNERRFKALMRKVRIIFQNGERD